MKKHIALISLLFLILPTVVFSHSITKLEQVVSSGNSKLLDQLLSENSDNVNTPTDNMNRDLLSHIAIKHGDLNTLKILLRHGADLSINSNYGGSSYRKAINQKNTEITEFIFSNPLPEEHLIRVFYRSIRAGNVLSTNLILKSPKNREFLLRSNKPFCNLLVIRPPLPNTNR